MREEKQRWKRSERGSERDDPDAQVDERIRMFRTTYSSFRHIWIGFSLPRCGDVDALCVFLRVSSVHWLRVRCFLLLLFYSLFSFSIHSSVHSTVSWSNGPRAALRFPRIWPRSMMCKYMYCIHTLTHRNETVFSSVLDVFCSLPFSTILLLIFHFNVCKCVRKHGMQEGEWESIDEY